jgi:cathepsin B
MPKPSNADIPKEFDSRLQWKDCIHPIRNQEKCGSCWAFAASEAFSDRLCIASKSELNLIFSPESLVECDKSDFGCQGGQL